MLRRAASAVSRAWAPITAAAKGPEALRSCLSTATTSATAAVKPELSAFILFVPSLVCGYMGYWQYERMQWKESLIQLRKTMLETDARNVFSEGEVQEYEKVSASGIYLHEQSVFIGPRPRSIPGAGIQSGYLVVTPLHDPKSKGTVMVNRGWVPQSWEGDEGTLKGIRPRETLVEGVIQPSEKPSAVVPSNVPEKLEFHWFDVPALARSCNLPADTPLIQLVSDNPATAQKMQRENPLVESRNRPLAGEVGPPQFPIPKNSSDLVKFATMPRDHMMYALTWATLFVVLGFMARQAVFFPAKHRKIVDNRHHWRAMTTTTRM